MTDDERFAKLFERQEITREDAISALKKAIEKEDDNAMFFWIGYLLGLP